MMTKTKLAKSLMGSAKRRLLRLINKNSDKRKKNSFDSAMQEMDKVRQDLEQQQQQQHEQDYMDENALNEALEARLAAAIASAAPSEDMLSVTVGVATSGSGSGSSSGGRVRIPSDPSDVYYEIMDGEGDNFVPLVVLPRVNSRCQVPEAQRPSSTSSSSSSSSNSSSNSSW